MERERERKQSSSVLQVLILRVPALNSVLIVSIAMADISILRDRDLFTSCWNEWDFDIDI